MTRRRTAPARGAPLLALSIVMSLMGPILAGCSQNNQQPVSATRGSREEYPSGPAASRPGLTGKQKMAILVGAAALYYLYKTHKQAAGTGAQGQYYLSKNGRVYYRDQNGNPHWVTPPRLQVPADEAQQYSQFAGYNGRQTGQTFGGYGATSAAPLGGPPGPP